MGRAAASPRAALALDRAWAYRLLAVGLAYPNRHRLLSTIAESAAEGGPRTRDLASRLGAALAAALTSESQGAESIGAAYNRLFLQTGLAPYEGSHIGGDRSALLVALRRLYREFGVTPADGAHQADHELADHAAVQLQFAGVVALKEAASLLRRQERNRRTARRAARLFLREHIGRWLPDVAQRLASDRSPFYRCVGSALDAFLAAEVHHLRVELPKRRSARRLPVIEDEAPIECG